MNRIVRYHIPAGLLPDELRGELDPSAKVTVTIEEERAALADTSWRAAALAERARIQGAGVSPEEAVARVRALRDEWEN